MVILVPVVAGESIIPKWILDQVTPSRDRAGFAREIRRVSIGIAVAFILVVASIVMWILESQLVNVNPWRYIVPTVIFLGFSLLGAAHVSRIRRARAWLDTNNKWVEISMMGWQASAPSPQIRNPFAPRVKGDTNIPHWVLARVTSSLDRKGLSHKIRRAWFLVVALGLLLLLPWLWILAYLLISRFDPTLITVILLLSLLWWFGLWEVIMSQRARTWLDRYQKWSEVAQLQWQGAPQPPP
jgi:hypothetical protein